jgi:hypothetical protein
MAIGRISGAMLKANLERQGTDLAVETDLLYIDVANDRIGINTNAPTTSLQADNVTINSSQIRSVSGPLDLGSTPSDITIGGGAADNILMTDGSGNLTWSPLSSLSGLNGMGIELTTPTDTSLTQYGAINSWTTTTKVTDSIDDLNEALQNVISNTAVSNVDFNGDTITGGAGLAVTLTITADGNPNRYTINWGDGTTDSAVTDSTPTHTYATNSGSPFSVDVTAFNNSGNGTGSTSSKSRASYITIYTSDPVVTFAAYANSSGGSPITQWDDGATVYFENTTTNTSGATIQYTWEWGDGSSDDVISADADAGGVGGGRLAHTFTASTEEEVTRAVSLTLDSHTTALPSAIPTDDSDSYKIYDTHTPTVGLSTTTGVNESATSGVPVTFSNTTESTIGSFATYGLQYLYTFGDGNTQYVNVGSGASGDTGGTIAHTYSLSGSDQANGTPQDYTGTLSVISDHASSPFLSSNFTVHVEPDVRAAISGTANRVSDRTGDNQYDVYDGTTYDGVNHALATVTNTTQNADDYVYNWNDGSSNDTVTEDGSSPGSIGATLGHDFAGVSTGNKTLNFTANGTPDLTAQTDTDTSIVFQVNAVPAAPNGLSSSSLNLADSAQGTSPYLCAGFTDNSASNPLNAGDSVNTSTARRYTSGTLDTNTVQNVYNGLSGTLTADINGADRGNRTFTTALNETGTTTSLVVSQQADAHDTISSSTYPTGFYQTFDAKITQALTDYTIGVNDQRLTHDATGNTNYVSIVRDDLTSTPTCDISSATITEASGTYNYISGVPYYNAGATLTLSGVEIYNWIGQTYRNTTTVFQVRSGTNVDSTTDSALSNQAYTYAQLENASYLSGGVPTANTGKDSGSPYAIANQAITLTSSTVTASEKIRVRTFNVNGTGSDAEIDQVVKVLTDSPSGVTELAIPVDNSLGNGTYTDDGKRITDFLSDTTDTPSYTGSTNFYTNALYTNASDPGVAGTKEASVLYNVLKHDTTDHSGVLPAGPNRSSDTGTQYFTFAFRRQVVANFDINITSSTGIEGMWIAAPGTGIDSASGLNGWLETTTQYAGAGVPGSDTGNGGNGSNGCALTGADVVGTGSLSGSYTMTLGSENMSNATGNVVLVRIGLASGDSVTALSIGEAS